jgi:hypothetical protein
VLGEGRLGGGRRGGPVEARHVALSPALRHQAAAGPERREQPLEEAVVVPDPVEHGVREDGVHRTLELELGELGPHHRRAVAQGLARVLHHRRRLVDGDHVTARQALQQHQRDPARPAAGVEDGLVASKVEPVEQRARPLHVRP